MNADKARVYLERSKASPIGLRLNERGDLSPHNPFLQIVPHAIGRLKSLAIKGTSENLQDITAHLSRPAPLLEVLSIASIHTLRSQRDPTLTTALFHGDFPSLRELHLQSVRTELPWRNVVNLTSFELHFIMSDEISIQQLLDFFESAPRLRKIDLCHATPTSGAQNGRLVSLACLKWMDIIGDESPSLFLDHLIIPVGAKLTTFGAARGSLTENLPRSLDNLRNLSDFTDIHLRIDEEDPDIRFSGPNGQVRVFIPPQDNATYLALESLARFDTSKTERLRIYYGYSPSNDSLYRALLPMKHLRTLTLSYCTSLDTLIHALDPIMSPSGDVVCPRLEDLVIVLDLDVERLDIKNVIETAAARASRGAKLKSVRIVGQDESMQIDALELRRHVSHVECGPGDGVADEDTDVSSEEN
jgi:hypothetical protein